MGVPAPSEGGENRRGGSGQGARASHEFGLGFGFLEAVDPEEIGIAADVELVIRELKQSERKNCKPPFCDLESF